MSDLKISNQHHTVRLLQKDNLHLTRKIKELKFTDKRFENNAAAIRYYVHLGISTECRTEVANSLDDKIIKASQKEVVTDSLLPLKNTLDELINVMETFGKKQDEHFSDARKQNDEVLRGVESLKELCSNQFGKIIAEILTNGRISHEALRNSIILRSILYVFLIGVKTGRIEPDDRTHWQTLIKFAHQKASDMTKEEIERITNGDLETSVVERLANEMFTEIKRLQPKPISK